MIWLMFISWYALASAVTAGAFWIDKRRAQTGGWRVPEKTLHALELAGGWPGAFAAMTWVRHKNRKPAYWMVTALIAAIHAGAWAWIGLKG